MFESHAPQWPNLSVTSTPLPAPKGDCKSFNITSPPTKCVSAVDENGGRIVGAHGEDEREMLTQPCRVKVVEAVSTLILHVAHRGAIQVYAMMSHTLVHQSTEVMAHAARAVMGREDQAQEVVREVGNAGHRFVCITEVLLRHVSNNSSHTLRRRLRQIPD
jgi:hypothetical protein